MKYFCMKETSVSKEIHKDFMETLGKESPSYNTILNRQFKREGESESVENDGRSDWPKDCQGRCKCHGRARPGYV